MQTKTRSLTEARQDIMQPAGVINLNAGTCSPVPKPVFAALIEQLRQQSADPAGYIWTDSVDPIESGRAHLAAILNASADQLLFCTNASWAVNTVLQSYNWKSGDEIILTDQEYHHYLPLLTHLKTHVGVTLRRVHLPLAPDAWTPEKIVALFTAQKNERTRMLFFSHVTSQTGSCLPAKDLCSWARSQGIATFIDGAHAPGHVAVDLADIDATFYTANTHKWLMNPAGCAFLHAAKAARYDFRPLMFMSGYDAWLERREEKTRFGYSRWQFAHEYQGTRNLTPFAVLKDTLRFIDEIKDNDQQGLAAIRSAWQRKRMLAQRALENNKLAVVSADGDGATCLVACRIPTSIRIDTIAARNFFRETHGLELAFPTLSTGENLLRVSAAWWNEDSDFERLDQVLREVDWNNPILRA